MLYRAEVLSLVCVDVAFLLSYICKNDCIYNIAFFRVCLLALLVGNCDCMNIKLHNCVHITVWFLNTASEQHTNIILFSYLEKKTFFLITAPLRLARLRLTTAG